MARVKSREDVRALAKHATVPVINALGASPFRLYFMLLVLYPPLVCISLPPSSTALYAFIPYTVDDWGHPCQILADFQTILETVGTLQGRKLAFVGDVNNNVTFDLMRGCAIMGAKLVFVQIP
jgi:ornithine carbamoyltransferase